MFFSRQPKEDKKYLELEEKTNLELRFQEKLEEVDRLTDPAEKILKLEEFRAELRQALNDRKSGVAKKIQKKTRIVQSAGDIAGVGAMVGITIASGGTAALVGAGAYLAGMFGGMVAGRKAGNSTRERLYKENGSIDILLLDQRWEIHKLVRDLVQDNVEEIAQSPFRNDLFDKFPDLTAVFAFAAAKKMAEDAGENNLPAAKKSSPKRKQQPGL